jgi:ribosomal protein RSM22 (predicted rRNA methylase)
MSLVEPLNAPWEAILNRVLRQVGSLSLEPADVPRLARKVSELSEAYNLGRAEGARTKLPLEARIAFSFPRDVPKGAAAVRELVGSGVLRLPSSRPLRVLDLGAGLGAMTWGLARALGASGGAGRIEARLVDEDPEVLRAAEAIARAAGPKTTLSTTGDVELAIATEVGTLESQAAAASRGKSPADVVILGQVLSEIDPRGAPEARLVAQADLVTRAAGALAEDGALVIVEPALKDRTRHLHLLRDRLLAGGGWNVFAPCLHSAACPALAVPGEWCHEDLAIDLPPWLVPLARAAGLRWQGLTFSYLVLRRDGRTLDLGPGPLRFRAVSELLRSKGKLELWTCSDTGVRARVRRLDRDSGLEKGTAFDSLRRGDLVRIRTECGEEPAIDERGRITPHVAIDVGPFAR